jgi:hypothetical protein
MWNAEDPVPQDLMPEEARAYAEAIVAYRDHPVVRDHFYQIRLCQLPLPDGGVVPFFVLEFRDAGHAIFVWSDGRGNWSVGDWRPLLPPDTPLHADLAYFHGRPGASSFGTALQQVLRTRPTTNA